MVYLGISIIEAENFLDGYDFNYVQEVVKELIRLKKVDRSKELQDTLQTIAGNRVGYASIQNKKNQGAFNSFFKKRVREINKLLGVEEPTIWDRVRKSRRI